MTAPSLHRTRAAPSARPHADAHARAQLQRQFAAAVNKLGAGLRRHAAWGQAMLQTARLVQQDWLPLMAAYNDRRRQLLMLFEQAHAGPSLSAHDRQALEDCICELALEFLEESGKPDAEVVALFEHYSGVRLRQEPETVAAVAAAVPPQALAQSLPPPVVPPPVRDMLAALAGEFGIAFLADDAAPGAGMASTSDEDAFLARIAAHLQPAPDGQTLLDTLETEQIKQCNRILRLCVEQLRREVLAMEGLVDHAKHPAPAMLLEQIHGDIAGLHERMAQIDGDLQAFRDIGRLKAWLRDEDSLPE